MLTLMTIFSTYYITLIITKSVLFKKIRDFLTSKMTINKFYWFLGKISTCFMCCSVWVSTIITLIYYDFILPEIILILFAKAGIAYIIHLTVYTIESIGDYYYNKVYNNTNNLEENS